MTKPAIYVQEIDGKFGLFINGYCLGYSKLQCDATMHMHFLADLIGVVYNEAYDAGDEHDREEEANDPTVAPYCPICHTQRLRCANGCAWIINDKLAKSADLLESFATFCQSHPDLYFWVALQVWTDEWRKKV